MRFSLVRSLVDRVLAGERADRALAAALRSQRDLSSEERRLVAEWSLGLALWRGRIDRMANGDRALWLPLFLLDREKWSLADVVHATGANEAQLAKALATSAPADPVERLSFEQSLPLWLARRWIDQLGLDRATSLAQAMNLRGPIAIRSNIARDELQQLLNEEGIESRTSTLVETGLILLGRPNIVVLNAWRRGLFEVQDEGSQLIAAAVEAEPGGVIVDLCAGSGGKTLALAASMRNRGRLIALDPEAQRLSDLAVRTKRAGITCVETRAGDGRDEDLWRDLVGRADAVLVDAPCSSLGTLRRGPDARWRLAENEPERWCELQSQLLAAASRLVRPGGRLVYATCSVDPVENEAVTRTLSDPTFELVRERRTWPDIDGCDGFYWSVFRR